MKRSILKKMIVLTLAFAMVFSSVITAVSANEAELTAVFTATADKESYVAGDTVVVTVAANGDAVDAIGLDFVYDDALTLVSAEWAVDAAIVDVADGRAAIAFDAPVALAGELFVITLTVNADAEDDTYNVTVTPKAKNGTAIVATDVAVADVVVASHKCAFVGYEKDETGHWQKCECGITTDVAAHEYANNCDDTCDVCGYVRTVGDHEWGEWIIDTAATNSAEGSKHRECSCGETETKVIPRNLRMTGVNLTLASSISVNFQARGNLFTQVGYTDPYMKIVMNGKETIVTEFTKLNDANDNHAFTFSITPQTMNDSFEYYLCAYYEGELYESELRTYVIADYCYTQLGKAATAASMKTLLVDLLNYGTSVQLYRGHNTANLCNAKLTEQQKALGSTLKYAAADYNDVQNTKYTDADHAVLDAPTAKFTGISLVLGDVVEVTLNVTLPEDLTNVKLIVTNDMSTWEILPADFVSTGTVNKYKITFGELAAHQMDDTVLFTFYDGDVAISNTLSYSVESYVAKNIAKSSTSATLKEVLANMMAYGYSAQNAK